MIAGDVVSFLSQHIEAWLVKSGSSLQALSSQSSVSYSTLRRIHKKQCAHTGSDTSLAVLKATGATDTLIRDVLNNFYDGLGEVLYQGEAAEDLNQAIINKLADSFLVYRIFASCDTVFGSSETEIKERFGSEGIKIVDQLINDELLKKDSSGNIVRTVKKWSNNSWSSTVKMMIHCLNCISEESIDNKLISLWLETEGVNLDGLKQLKINARKKHIEDRKVLENPEFQGEIPVFSLSAVGSFINK
ncbi:MAG: hypothetical protein ACOH5I_15310 [Oligoflexus sp.]